VVFLGTLLNQLSLPESLSLEEYDECGELESKLHVTRIVSLIHNRVFTEDENDVGQPMVRIAL
jgi:hypothetical protein